MKHVSLGKYTILSLIIFTVAILGTVSLSFYNKTQFAQLSNTNRDNIDWAFFQIERLFYPIHQKVSSNNLNSANLSTDYEVWASSFENLKGSAYNFLLNYSSPVANEDFINSMQVHYDIIQEHIKNIDSLKSKNGKEWSLEATQYLQKNNDKIFQETQILSLLANQKISLYWSEKGESFRSYEHVENLFLIFDTICFLILGFLLFHFLIKIRTSTQELFQSNELLTSSRDETLSIYQSKAMFITKLSHELKTPLNSIIGFSEVLANDNANPLNVEQLKNIKYVINASKMVSQLVNELLDFNSLESGKVDMHYTNFYLHDLINESESIVHNQLTLNNNKLILNVENIKVNADFLRFKQILINLLTNAIKYGFSNSDIIVSSEIINKTLLLHIENKGNPISENKKSMIFQPFFRGDYDNSSIAGYGIGLSLVKKLSQLMNGDITFTSSNDKTVFTLTLPIIDENLEEESSTLADYVIIISQHQRFIEAILNKIQSYKNIEPLVVPDISFAKDIIEYSNISHVIYTEGNMNNEFNEFISQKNIDSIKFDLDVVSENSVSLDNLDIIFKRWSIK